MKYSVIVAVGLVAGIIATTLIVRPSIPQHWFTLTPMRDDSGVPSGSSATFDNRVPVGFDSAVLFGSDIPPLSVTSVAGKAKFISHTSSTGSRCPIGYIIVIATESLDKTNLPEKYKKERVIPTKRGPFTQLPIEQATYEVEFSFRLLDRDGFELATVTSRTHTVASGRTREIQSQTEPSISAQIASVTDSIAVEMHVKKCLTSSIGE